MHGVLYFALRLFLEQVFYLNVEPTWFGSNLEGAQQCSLECQSN